MKIYTKTGDDGQTGLWGGDRVSKGDTRIEAFGTVDELNSNLGVIRAHPLAPEVDALLEEIQADLFQMGAELATAGGSDATVRLEDHRTTILENAIDHYQSRLPPLKQFVIPAGTPTAAASHVARAVCRRAERCVVRLRDAETGPEYSPLLRYLNRLGDLLFVLARLANVREGCTETVWTHARPPA